MEKIESKINEIEISWNSIGRTYDKDFKLYCRITNCLAVIFSSED
jgi:hypothetical protein